MRLRKRHAMMLCIAWSALGAHAAVWRCGNVYSDRPCEAGRTVDTEDPRSAAQQRDAQAAADRNAVLAQSMEKARLRQEATAPRAPAVIEDPRQKRTTPQSTPTPASTHKKARKHTTKVNGDASLFTARSPRQDTGSAKK